MPSVSQLKCEGILDAVVIRPVDAAPTSWVCKSEENTIGAYFPSGCCGKGLVLCLDGVWGISALGEDVSAVIGVMKS